MTGNLFVDQTDPESHKSAIAEYGPFGEPFSAPIETFPSEGLEESHGVAVNGATGTVYTSERGADSVEMFAEVSLPEAVTSEASNLQAEGSATLNGTVNPEGLPVTSCEFEYGPSTAYGTTAECASNPGSGSAPVAVHADLTGLAFDTYHYRLVAGNANGTVAGQDRSFLASARPAISGESLAGAGSTIAAVSAQINPDGLASTYRLEYGTSTAYGSSTPDTSVGAGAEAAAVEVQLTGLQPGAVYHARFVATNGFGTTSGADVTFTTAESPGAATSALPDGRAYELVSTAGKAGEVYVPDLPQGSDRQITTRRLFQAASDGGAVAYVGAASVSGGNGDFGPGVGNEWLAKRTAEGWKALDITPPASGTGTLFESFSSDLTSWILRWSSQEGVGSGSLPPLAPAAPAGCRFVPYFHPGDRGYEPLITTTRSPGVLACGEPHFAGASADDSQILFQSEAPLTEEAEEAEEPGEGGHSLEEERCAFSCNLYESAGGRVRLVNVLPSGESAPNATFGGPSGIRNAPDFSNVISTDGSRVFWTDTQPGADMDHIYARVNGASTIPVSVGSAKFWTASPDGRYVFYTEEEKLYRFDIDTDVRAQLAGEGLAHESAGAQGVLGINQTGEDGAYIYLVATGVLADNENANGEKATLGEDNLYLLHNGRQTFIAALSPEDNNIQEGSRTNGERYGDWQPDLGSRTAEMTPDGHHLVFESLRPLTGYDNVNENHEVEVFVYSADVARTVCASCNPTGAAPQIPLKVEGTTHLSPSISDTHMPRWISDDGSRVFFDSSQPLAPQDTNGGLDVYEWEQDGAGSCHSDGGCVYLLSDGESSDFSYFVEADASGENVFFAHNGQVGGFGPPGEQTELYDARVGGGFPATSFACAGSGCQGVPPAPPSFTTPSSATFNGSGNFPPPPKTGRQTRKKTLGGALKLCRAKRNRHRRMLCEAQVRRRQAPHRGAGKSGAGKSSRRAPRGRRK